MRFHIDVVNAPGFRRTRNEMTAMILGKPESFKRPGGIRHRYDTQRGLKNEFVYVLFQLHQMNNVIPTSFGTDDVEIDATFVFARRNGKILNDIDNLSKFLLDCLQLPFPPLEGSSDRISIYNNDNQVVKLSVRKEYGDVAMTRFSVVRHVIDLTNDDDVE